jgi:hypothetical protein
MHTVRHIKTQVVPVLGADNMPLVENGRPVTRVVPELDADGQEIVLWSVEIPSEVEAEGGEAIDAYVAAQRAALAVRTVASPAAVPVVATIAATEEQR